MIARVIDLPKIKMLDGGQVHLRKLKPKDLIIMHSAYAASSAV